MDSTQSICYGAASVYVDFLDLLNVNVSWWVDNRLANASRVDSPFDQACPYSCI